MAYAPQVPPVGGARARLAFLHVSVSNRPPASPPATAALPLPADAAAQAGALLFNPAFATRYACRAETSAV